MPQSSDIVIRLRQDSPALYLLSSARVRYQVSCYSYEQAVGFASRLTRDEPADVWYTEDGQGFRLVSALTGRLS